MATATVSLAGQVACRAEHTEKIWGVVSEVTEDGMGAHRIRFKLELLYLRELRGGDIRKYEVSPDISQQSIMHMQYLQTIMLVIMLT